MPIVHPIKPVYDENSRILILGSFPSVKSREVGFYYGHPQNRFWKVISTICADGFDAYTASVSDKKQFLQENHIAIWDVIGKCTITGSADSTIEDVIVNDLGEILQKANISTIYINGNKAYELYMKYTYSTVLKKFGSVANAVALPSTSPANAAMSIEVLVASWSRIKNGLNVTGNYYSLNDYVRNTFGHKLYKLSLDGGFTCPNRDGTIGDRGCIFCDGDGSGAFAGLKRIFLDEAGDSKENLCLANNVNIYKQLEAQKELVSAKLPADGNHGFIAYFQAFTGTYAPVDILRKLYYEAIADDEVEVLSIATRPDCLDEPVLALLSEINKIKPVWVELGLQSIHKKTAEYIRRGYSLKVYDRAVRKLKKIGIRQVVTHVILGLPGESTEDMKDTARYVGRSASDGIKLQLLHVLNGTDLAEAYEDGAFKVMDMDTYIETLKECINELPRDMVIHRLTGDGDKRKLIAPLWSGDKKRVLNAINKAL